MILYVISGGYMKIFKKKADYNKEEYDILMDIRKNLELIEFYNDYEKIINKAKYEYQSEYKKYLNLRTDDQLFKALQAEIRYSKLIEKYKKIDFVKVNAKLAGYEMYLDKKFWSKETLNKLILIVRFKIRNSIADAVEFYKQQENK